MKYWHISDFEGTEIVQSVDNPSTNDANAYGPFDSFSEAKNDAFII